MAVSSHKLAAALADRLNAVVPSRFRLSSMGPDVHFADGDQLVGISKAPSIVDDFEDGRSPEERVENVARVVMSLVQDYVMRGLTEPWPSRDGAALGLPSAFIAADELELWFGEPGGAKVVTMPNIRLSEL